MNTADIIIIAVIAVCVGAALWKCIANFRQGKCCGECSGCGGKCRKKK